MKEWNERYVIWSQFNGNTPDSQLELDKQKYKGGCMCGFNLWINKRVEEFKKEMPQFCVGTQIQNHSEFNNFLRRKSI